MITKREAAIISAYTGILLGEFSEMQLYAEKVLGRGVLTHEFAERELWEELKMKARPDFLDLEVAE